MHKQPEPPSPTATAWLSRGVETLCADIAAAVASGQRPALDFDVVIVGSGYGGAMAAAELAGCTVADGSGGMRPVSVCVLERGREYLPGSFPSRFSELPGHVRVGMPGAMRPAGPRDGLFDIRAGEDCAALVGNGLGGGSLINAGVMIEPAPEVFDAAWPEKLRTDPALPSWYALARRLLGAGDDNGANTIGRHAAGVPQKHLALQALVKDSPLKSAFRMTDVTVAMGDGDNQAGVRLPACKRCGDCATGCNHGAKNSLDANLLVTARRRGAALYTGATVLRIGKLTVQGDEAWSLDVVHTDDQLRQRQGGPLRLRARRVILAAGTFGSTEILLRSRDAGLALSNMLGQRFSGNGDMIAAGYRHAMPVNAVADENTPAEQRHVGPTITGMIDLRRQHGVLIQEMAVPGPLRRIYEEAVTTAGTLRSLDTESTLERCAGSPDPHAIDPDAISRSAVYAVMGDDGAQGRLELPAGGAEEGDGSIRMRWPGLREKPLFSKQIDRLQALADGSAVKGTILPNPLWQLLPPTMAHILNVDRGPVLTVHPLGGCPMGSDCASGVVDDCGRVFDRAAQGAGRDAHFKGLAVLDGAIVPRALGANPALTIAALSLRAVRALRADWGMLESAGVPAGALPENLRDGCARPVFQPASTPAPVVRTEVGILERMHGRVTLQGADGLPQERIVELTLRFAPIAVTDLTAPGGARLRVETAPAAEAASRIRVFDAAKWQAMMNGALTGESLQGIAWSAADTPDRLLRGAATEDMLDAEAELVAPLSGELAVFVREDSAYLADTWTTMWAWFRNRGLRDGLESAARLVVRRLRGAPPEGRASGGGLLGLAANTWALASHARLARRLEYTLRIGAPLRQSASLPQAAGMREGAILRGHKRLVYAHRANPWRQLQEMTLDTFPGLPTNSRPVLKLDTRFLANQQWPLLRVVRQQDQPTALADLGALLAYVLRMMATIHSWSFRKPDALPDRKPQRLPGFVPGLPPPQIHELEVDRLPDGTPVHVRLTRYRRDGGTQRPLVMIHGYSASGTTFAHHAVRPNLAGYFWERGRDVWILDLRTSSGMPTARHPWKFEDVAFADIPAAINYIHGEVNRVPGAARKLDVVAHCMGSAMLSMALLKPTDPCERYALEREALQARIGNVVLSQVGPVVVFTPDNILRSYLMRYVRQMLPMLDYTFQPAPDSGLADQLLDRLLATLPYPEDEFELENPPLWKAWRQTPFTGIRHRMDALYGRAFQLANLAPATLRSIDDLFGPLSLETVAQVIHFARFRTITNRNGINEFVSRDNIRRRWPFPTLSIHGTENGLADISTLARMQQVFDEAGADLTALPVPGYGHQDCLIGKEVEKDVFVHVDRFLQQATAVSAAAREAPPSLATLGDMPQQAQDAQRSKDAEDAEDDKCVVHVPWIGPIVAGGAAAHATLSFAASSHPLLGRPAFIACVPVNRAGDRFSLATTEGMRQEPPAPLRVDPLSDLDLRDGWCRRPIDVQQWRGRADALLILFVYPHASRLGAPEYDKLLHPQNLPQRAIEDAVARYLAGSDGDELAKGMIALPPPVPATMRTARSSGTADSGVVFALASCQYPAGMVDSEPAHASYRRLAGLLTQPDALHKPGFLLLLGDQIYADATAGLFDPTVADDRFGRRYEEWLRNPDVRTVFRHIPVYAMLDDHEIEDNWEPRRGDRSGRRRMKDGRSAYLRYLRSAGPAPEAPFMDSVLPLWYRFAENGFPFFMLDTRTERMARKADTAGNARIMSDGQFLRLTQWLDEHRDSDLPKFIASPSILLPRLRCAHQDGHVAGALRSDAWDGYPASLHALLAYIVDRGIRNLVFLSGDEHLSCDATVTLTGPGGKTAQLRSIHSSALYAPFPFANSTPADLASEECFVFSSAPGTAATYTCAVTTRFAPAGDGFAVIRAAREGDAWAVHCDWNRE